MVGARRIPVGATWILVGTKGIMVGARRIIVGAVVALLVAGTPVSGQRSGLTGAAGLTRAYTAIFDANFDQVPALLADACGPAPAEACQLLDVASLWWQIQIDPYNRSHDVLFVSRADAAIAAIEAWTAREPMRGEAWFYLGGAYGARAQWRVLRGERLAAARDGKHVKEALERALALDPTLQDAFVGIGLYHYYAGVAPAAAKMLRWLLLLPGGDKTAGLQEIVKARASGQLLRDEADYQLHLIYLWYEEQPERALDVLRGLHERHPRNPHLIQLIAEVQDYRLRDFPASLRTYQEMLDLALAKRLAHPAFAEMHARLGVARLSYPEDALPHLRIVIDAAPQAPVGAVAQAQFQRGQMLERLEQRTDAAAAYRAAIAAVPAGDPLKTANAARAALRALRR
jgi:tetratricopeptide (TPR) repeat protein